MTPAPVETSMSRGLGCVLAAPAAVGVEGATMLGDTVTVDAPMAGSGDPVAGKALRDGDTIAGSVVGGGDAIAG